MQKTTSSANRQVILEMKNVELGRRGKQLVITATGTVPTAGWKNPELVPFVYVQAPPDGIYDFQFTAEAPDGVTAQVITPIELRHTVNMELRGVRIHASLNSMEALVADCGAVDERVAA